MLFFCKLAKHILGDFSRFFAHLEGGKGEVFVESEGVLPSPLETFVTNFQKFASISVQRYGIPSIHLFPPNSLNGIPRVSCSLEQPGYYREKKFVFCLFGLPRNNFFVGNFKPY
jgi:hypothetical protein